jgi:folate-binding protein YgfZ
MESQGKTTLKSMYSQWNLLTLAYLGVVRARGRDVVAFLQGQLSADLATLTREHSLLAGCHNPQGRVLALMRLLEGEPGEVLAVLPRELIGPIVGRLKGFVLRSKVELADECAAQLPAAAGAVAHLGSARLVRIDDDPARWLSLSPATAPVSERPAGLADCASADSSLWRRLAVRRGQPEVYAATSGEFVAQMLNLDVLGAIAFDKGCYTGQEVIARAHYRGRVKRRLQRFGSAAPLPLAPGAAGTLADGRTVRVVEVAQTPDGGCEFLAVAPIGAASGEPAGAVAAATLRLEATRLPLPYELPE